MVCQINWHIASKHRFKWDLGPWRGSPQHTTVPTTIFRFFRGQQEPGPHPRVGIRPGPLRAGPGSFTAYAFQWELLATSYLHAGASDWLYSRDLEQHSHIAFANVLDVAFFHLCFHCIGAEAPVFLMRVLPLRTVPENITVPEIIVCYATTNTTYFSAPVRDLILTRAVQVLFSSIPPTAQRRSEGASRGPQGTPNVLHTTRNWKLTSLTCSKQLVFCVHYNRAVVQRGEKAEKRTRQQRRGTTRHATREREHKNAPEHHKNNPRNHKHTNWLTLTTSPTQITGNTRGGPFATIKWILYQGIPHDLIICDMINTAGENHQDNHATHPKVRTILARQIVPERRSGTESTQEICALATLCCWSRQIRRS